jgi:hypothetical protein
VCPTKQGAADEPGGENDGQMPIASRESKFSEKNGNNAWQKIVIGQGNSENEVEMNWWICFVNCLK